MNTPREQARMMKRWEKARMELRLRRSERREPLPKTWR